MHKVSVLGCGYVGLVSGAGIAKFGNEVICADTNAHKIENLNKMIMPISEPELKELVQETYSLGRLSFSSDIKKSIRDCDAVIISVQTPQDKDGSADLSYVMQVSKDIAEQLEKSTVVIIKSTVPIGTAKKIRKMINTILAERKAGFSIEVVSNPEFLREGSAVKTFLYPDRIVVGYSGNKDVFAMMGEIYKSPIETGVPLIKCSNETAETIKYAANSFLAMKISYINQIALLCEKTGADIKIVAEAVGSDERINPKFLNPGPGYGGSCFPKDTRALVKIAEEYDIDLSMIRTAYEANTKHKDILARKAVKIVKENNGNVLGVWGLSFKAGSGDMRNAPALDILPLIIKNGIKLRVFDPEAMYEAGEYLSEYKSMIEFCKTKNEVLVGADALMILAEWDCFKNADLEKTATLLQQKILLDYRNIYDSSDAKRLGYLYYGVGK
ncbi:MAG: UDP-glucose/GDP-mannose dehydrogenase family protein [Clostridiales bacterium]|nr:UDP-glucose/GDP-mannose dehydrogenase family protein [Clostridiales bacterium]